MSDEKIQPTHAPILLGKVGLSPHDDLAVAEWPTLMQLLLPNYDDKKRLTREPGILSIRVDGSIFRLTIICPTEGLQTTLGLDSIVGLFEALEGHVRSTTAVWVPTYDSKKKTGQALKKVLES